MSKNFNKYKSIVESEIASATKAALKTPIIKHKEIFEGMINTSGSIHSMVEQTDGGMVVGGNVDLSMLQRNTDIPTIGVQDNTSVTTNEVAANISKMQCSTIDMTNKSKDMRSIIHENAKANLIMHFKKIDETLIQGSEVLELQNVYGLGNHPKVTRMFNESGKQIKDMSPQELLNFFLETIQDFSNANQNVDFMDTLTMVLTPAIVNKMVNSVVSVGGTLVSIKKALEDHVGAYGKLVIKTSTAIGSVKAHLPANETKQFFAIGFFDPYFATANIPVAPALFGKIGLNSHQENATFLESYFVSKCLGLSVKNTGELIAPIAIVEGA